MNRKPIPHSSNIKSVGYSRKFKSLEIEFHGGRVYLHTEVPEAIVRRLRRAHSSGAYYAEHVRDKFPVRRLEDTKIA